MISWIRSGGWIAALALCLGAGCATNKVDWAGRVGGYTFDQAVVELGPPDKQAKLSDGVIVAEWLTRRGRSGGYSVASGYYGHRGHPYYAPAYYEPGTPDHFLRLSFGRDGRLTAWKKLSR
jgi:hypothetical protein